MACSYFCDDKTKVTCFILCHLSADWANLIKCLQTCNTDSLEQSTSTLPASAAIPGNCTAAQASNPNGADHSSGDNSTTGLQEMHTVISVVSVGFYARTAACRPGPEGSIPNTVGMTLYGLAGHTEHLTAFIPSQLPGEPSSHQPHCCSCGSAPGVLHCAMTALAPGSSIPCSPAPISGQRLWILPQYFI